MTSLQEYILTLTPAAAWEEFCEHQTVEQFVANARLFIHAAVVTWVYQELPIAYELPDELKEHLIYLLEHYILFQQ